MNFMPEAETLYDFEMLVVSQEFALVFEDAEATLGTEHMCQSGLLQKRIQILMHSPTQGCARRFQFSKLRRFACHDEPPEPGDELRRIGVDAAMSASGRRKTPAK
ncbi:hypothetical protein DY251_16495 [Mesorhizobium denitrificans]|uniref:Uncharacterized protein n=1 Tax=Mesorhizobium denitrificans TaxID=2294114 RepID=A0A371XA30_9HYPH|nr:hypothetical protein DY251_16495 [Mesorhizobium denitrificans]